MAVSDINPTADFVLSHLNEIQQIKRGGQDLTRLNVRAIWSNTSVNRSLNRHPFKRGMVTQPCDSGFAHWKSDSDVVLFLDGREGNRTINYYAFGLQGLNSTAAMAVFQPNAANSGLEEGNTIACFKLLLNDYTPDAMFAEVARHLVMLD